MVERFTFETNDNFGSRNTEFYSIFNLFNKPRLVSDKHEFSWTVYLREINAKPIPYKWFNQVCYSSKLNLTHKNPKVILKNKKRLHTLVYLSIYLCKT